MAATAAHRLGLAPTFAPLDRPSFHVDGRDNRAEAPEEPVSHITRGDNRAHRPDLTHVMLALIVDQQAGMPLLMKPLSGHRRDAQDFGPVVTEPLAHLQTPDGMTYLVAESARSSAETRQTLAATRTPWLTRVPAPWSEAPAVLAQADPPTMTPPMAGYRSQQATSTSGGVPQRWLLVYADYRRPHAQRLGDKAWLKQRAAEATAVQQRCHTADAWAEDAQHARTTCAQALQATAPHERAVQPMPRDRRRGRPRPDPPPARIVYRITGALASWLAAHEARVAPHRCFILATHELDACTLPPRALLAGYKGQQHADRGVRFLKDPRFLAASLYLKKPERIMALLMVMTVCLLVDAALEDRIRQTLTAHQATCPHQTGHPVQNPTARWVFQYCAGLH